MARRILKNETKVAIVVAAMILVPTFIIFAATMLPDAMGNEYASMLIGTLSLIAIVGVVLYCTRNFRGDNEEIQPPREWWRMTARPMSGFIFGAFFGATVVTSAYDFLSGNVTLSVSPTLAIVTFAVTAIITIMFFVSSIRLMRMEKLEQEPASVLTNRR